MTFNIVEGDLFKMDFDAIGHGVNTYGVMGAGIALEFKRQYPFMFKQYEFMCRAEQFDPGDVYPYFAGDYQRQWVYNLASQSMPGPHARLDWVKESVTIMFEHAKVFGVKHIGLPAIGCGIGGLNFSDVSGILLRTSDMYANVDLTLVLYKP